LYGKLKKGNLLKIGAAIVIVTVAVIALKPWKNHFVDSFCPVILFCVASALYRIADSIIYSKGFKNKFRRMSIYAIHLGIALTLAGTVISAVYDQQTSVSFDFPKDKGVKKRINKEYSIALQDFIVYKTYDGWWTTALDLEVHKNGKKIGRGIAESIDDKKFGRVTHVYIHKGLTDVYVIFQGISRQIPGSIIAPATVKIVPGIGILWLGVIMLSFGCFVLMLLDLKLPKSRNTIKAPEPSNLE
jgi:cytochrome c biogenesis factor